MWNVRIVWNDILMYHMIHIVKYLFMLLNFFIILNKFKKWSLTSEYIDYNYKSTD